MRKLFRSIPILAFGLIFALSLISSCANIPKPRVIRHGSEENVDWGTDPPSRKDMAKHTFPGRNYFEWWYFDCRLDTGETFVGTFHDPNFIGGNPGVTFSLYSPDWKRESYMVTLKPGEMQESSTDLEITSSFGYVHRVDDATLSCGWSFEGIRADFTFETAAPGWLPRDMTVKSESVDFFWTIHQASARVEGYIEKDGVKRHVKGEGYSDHNWGKRPLNEITRYWVWGRIITGEYSIVYADVFYRDPAIVSRPLYIAKGNKMLAGSGSPGFTLSEFETHTVLGRHYPGLLIIDYKGKEAALSLEIRFKALVEEIDLLSIANLGGFEQWFARTFIARPSYFRIIAECTGRIQAEGSTTPVTGECIYEVMCFE